MLVPSTTTETESAANRNPASQPAEMYTFYAYRAPDLRDLSVKCCRLAFALYQYITFSDGLEKSTARNGSESRKKARYTYSLDTQAPWWANFGHDRENFRSKAVRIVLGLMILCSRATKLRKSPKKRCKMVLRGQIFCLEY